MKVVEGTLIPLREVGARVPNYLNDWPILAQSREQLCDHRDLVLWHFSQWGLRVNWEKSKLSPVQRIFFLGVRLSEYDGMPHGRACPSSAELPEFLQRQECCTTETVSKAPGAYGIRSCSHAPRTSVPVYGCLNRYFRHGLWRYMQRAGSLGALHGARLLWHINCLEPWTVHLALR